MKLVKRPLQLMIALLFIATTTAFGQEKISDSELTNFANAFIGIQQVNQDSQSKMVVVIEGSGMDIATFNSLYQALQNPNAPAPEGITEEDKEKFQEVTTELKKMQPAFQKEMENIIAENNLTVDRYQQMITLVQADTELQQRLQSKMQQ